MLFSNEGTDPQIQCSLPKATAGLAELAWHCQMAVRLTLSLQGQAWPRGPGKQEGDNAKPDTEQNRRVGAVNKENAEGLWVAGEGLQARSLATEMGKSAFDPVVCVGGSVA